LENKDKTGIEPCSKIIHTKKMTLDLGSIKFKVKPTKSVKVSGIGIFE
jgi:hypothetical protein